MFCCQNFNLARARTRGGRWSKLPHPLLGTLQHHSSNVINFAQSDLVRAARRPPFLVTCSGPVDQWQQNRVVARRRIRRTCCSWRWRHRFKFQNLQAITIIYGYTQLWRMKHKMTCSYNKLLIQSKHTKTRAKTSTCYSFFLKRDELWRHSESLMLLFMWVVAATRIETHSSAKPIVNVLKSPWFEYKRATQNVIGCDKITLESYDSATLTVTIHKPVHWVQAMYSSLL